MAIKSYTQGLAQSVAYTKTTTHVVRVLIINRSRSLSLHLRTQVYIGELIKIWITLESSLLGLSVI